MTKYSMCIFHHNTTRVGESSKALSVEGSVSSKSFEDIFNEWYPVFSVKTPFYYAKISLYIFARSIHFLSSPCTNFAVRKSLRALTWRDHYTKPAIDYKPERPQSHLVGHFHLTSGHINIHTNTYMGS